jgi:hypothetical protein
MEIAFRTHMKYCFSVTNSAIDAANAFHLLTASQSALRSKRCYSNHIKIVLRCGNHVVTVTGHATSVHSIL